GKPPGIALPGVREQAQLVLVHLHDVETAQPLGPVLERPRHPQPVRPDAEKDRVQVGIDRCGKRAPELLRRFEIELEPGDQVDVEGIERVNDGLQLLPRPWRDPAGESLEAPLSIVVAQLDAVVWCVDNADSRLEIEVGQRLQEAERGLGQVRAEPDDRDDPRGVAGCGRGTPEGIRDPAPFLDRHVPTVTRIDAVPDHAAEYADALHRVDSAAVIMGAQAPPKLCRKAATPDAHAATAGQTRPYVSFLNTPAAPMTP